MPIPDYSMIYTEQIYHSDTNNDSINDALWCQSANNNSDIGLWYYPDGTQVPLFSGNFSQNNGIPHSIYSKRFSGQIALARSSGLSSGHEGLYTCVIPDQNGVNQVLVVGAYRSDTYNTNGQ